MIADYRVVDVFTSKSLYGNPVAVVLSADNLSTEQMQHIAKWTNLSETTFVCQPRNGGSYYVRIFTPMSELSFAGHPSLGTAHALIDAGVLKVREGDQIFLQECGRGTIPIKKFASGELQFELQVAPPKSLTAKQFEGLQHCLNGLKLEPNPSHVDSGPQWVVVETDKIQDLLDFKQDDGLIKEYSLANNFTGITVFAVEGDEVEVRTFAAACGVSEDPVCGSGNAAVARHRNLQGPYVAHQGRKLGRDGAVLAECSDDLVHIGGHCVVSVRGSLQI